MYLLLRACDALHSLKIASGGHNYVVGEWESFTNGIGSKLLAKMGYTPVRLCVFTNCFLSLRTFVQQGKGLGRQGEGIVKPLGIDFKAPSKKNELLGLGHEDRNKDKEKQTDEAGNPIGPRKKRRRGKKKKQKTEEEEQPKTDMFDFLNDLGQAKKKSSEGSVKEAQAKDRSSRNDALYKKMTPKELEDRLKKKLIEKDDLVGKIQSLEESAKRNRARYIPSSLAYDLGGADDKDHVWSPQGSRTCYASQAAHEGGAHEAARAALGDQGAHHSRQDQGRHEKGCHILILFK